ncbi:MAG: long-chain fatty acid--CoA ligase [Proteobacteria bacterium]|nr:long-chain fatty acid--CoA ligase [Pseudomonadota bacterium]
MNIIESILSRAVTYGNKPALIQGVTYLTYSDLYREVRKQADALKFADKRKARVAMSLANSIDDIILALAVILKGHALIALSPNASDQEKNNHLRCCEADAVLERSENKFETKVLDSLRCFYPEKESTAFIRPTSGTTGSSKGVILSHQCIEARTDSVAKALKLGIEDRIIWTMSASLHFASSILAYLMAGTTVILAPDTRPETVLSLAQNHQASLLYGSPWLFRMLAADSNTKKLPHLRWAISTGHALSESVAISFQHRFGHPLRQAYGIIEAGLVCINTQDDSNPLTVGPAAPGFDIRICDEEGNNVADGQIGEVCIKSESVFSGYIYPQRSPATLDKDKFFSCGDLGIIEKKCLRLVGRKASQINVAGLKVFPEEIESVLESHPEILKSRVYGIPESRIGHIIVAEVIFKSNKEIDRSLITNHCKKYLQSYKLPLKIIPVSEIIHTASGKVKRY